MVSRKARGRLGVGLLGWGLPLFEVQFDSLSAQLPASSNRLSNRLSNQPTGFSLQDADGGFLHDDQ